jgi:hypothetical protein
VLLGGVSMPTKRGVGKGTHKLTFYVFYDKRDFVRCFGTAYDLVQQGLYKNEQRVRESAYYQNKRRPNSVVKIVVPKNARRSVLNDR